MSNPSPIRQQSLSNRREPRLIAEELAIRLTPHGFAHTIFPITGILRQLAKTPPSYYNTL